MSADAKRYVNLGDSDLRDHFCHVADWWSPCVIFLLYMPSSVNLSGAYEFRLIK